MPRKKRGNKLLCHCLTVTWQEVEDTIREHRCKTVKDVTLHCSAGGGCKTCHPEITELIAEVRAERRGLLRCLGGLFGRSKPT